MKFYTISVSLLIFLLLIFFFTGCSESIPEPEPSPAPVRLVITGLEEKAIITTGDASVIVAQGSDLYFTGHRGNPGNLGIIDFSDPLNPEIMGTVSIGFGRGIAVNDDHIFVQMDPANTWPGCVALFEITDSYTLTDPTYVTTGYYVGCQVYYKNGFLYSCSYNALSVYNATSQYDIFYVKEVPTTDCMWAAIQGDYLYTSQSTKMVIYDISDPGNLLYYLGEVTFSSGLNGGIAVNSNYVYVGDNTLEETIHIIKAFDPVNPVYVASYTLADTSLGWINELKILPRYLLGVADNGFFVLDISDPENPGNEITLNSTISEGWGFAISGNYVIVSNGTQYHVIELLTG